MGTLTFCLSMITSTNICILWLLIWLAFFLFHALTESKIIFRMNKNNYKIKSYQNKQNFNEEFFINVYFTKNSVIEIICKILKNKHYEIGRITASLTNIYATQCQSCSCIEMKALKTYLKCHFFYLSSHTL